MSSLVAPAVIAALLLSPGTALAFEKNGEDEGDRPELDIRATPRTGFSPLSVLFTLELKEGDDREDYYCPELEWDWDDGGRSVQESDCPPLESGGEFDRRYTNTHAFRQAGTYNVKVTLRKANRSIAVAATTVTVRPGLGDFTSPD